MHPVATRLRHTLQLSALDDIKEVDPSAGMLVYRFVRGAIANAYEHAGADIVRVEAECQGGELLLQVTDDGQGFDVTHVDRFIQEGHYFFHDIKIRAVQLGGTFSVASARGKGTTLKLRVPFVQCRA